MQQLQGYSEIPTQQLQAYLTLNPAAAALDGPATAGKWLRSGRHHTTRAWILVTPRAFPKNRTSKGCFWRRSCAALHRCNQLCVPSSPVLSASSSLCSASFRLHEAIAGGLDNPMSQQPASKRTGSWKGHTIEPFILEGAIFRESQSVPGIAKERRAALYP